MPKRFEGLRDSLVSHLNAVGSRGLAAIGSKSRSARDDEKTVTLQVGRSVFEAAPRNMRTELWMSSLQRKGIGMAAAAKYEELLLAPVTEEAGSDIDKDLARTFPSTKRFAAAEGQAALRRVLRAYAAYDPEVGYCQGLNFVAGLLLMYVGERHAFAGLVVLMQDRGLRTYYSTDMALLQTHLWQLGRLIPPRLCSHLEKIGVLPLLYGASWLMTCFSADFPASFSARVMDVIMSDKMDQALLKAAVALLKACESRLLQLTDMEDALNLLKLELPAWEDLLLHDVLTDAFSRPWSSRQLQLLGSLEGAETVAEALTRVQAANLAAASTDSLPVADSREEAGGASEGAPSPLGGPPSAGSTRAATPSAGGAAVVPLFPPPPSPRRTSSTGQWSAGGAAGGGSQASSRPSSRAGSHSGAWPGPADSNGGGGGGPQLASPRSLAAGPAGHHHQQQQPGTHSSRLAVLMPQQQPSQQQHGRDMIDMDSPRASDVGVPAAAWPVAGGSGSQQQAGDDWDPFHLGEASGLHGGQQQQQSHEQLQQQLQDLSFSTLPAGQQQQQLPQRQAVAARGQQEQQQQQQDDSGGAHAAAGDDDWGDFLSPS